MTIFALSTIEGQSGVAIIRVSGPESKKTIKKITGLNVKPRYATLATIKTLKGKNIDELLLELNLIEDDIYPVIEKTDIFTWAVFRENAKRILKIKNGKLVYCQFSLGFVTMKAEIIEK